MTVLPNTPRRRTILIVAAAAVVCALLVVGGILLATGDRAPTASSSSTKPASTATPTTAADEPVPDDGPVAPVNAPAVSTVAAVLGSEVAVSAEPGGAPAQSLPNPQTSGAPLVFLVVAQQGDWVQVQLAQRPNGSTGWIPASSVELSETPYALVVTTSTNTLDLYDSGSLVASYPVATGTGGTPTPRGQFALTELLAPTNSGYGPYAYGMTAFSEALNSFGGGPGQIGLHGTDDASSIGTDASHGCVRMRNEDITALAELLPLGTPIQVR
ncbi:L,D-transpeptidase [Microbacterium sp. 179-I 3D4 NHS]|uniref:L,D-transpeptidase n=1 Tax=Microbacterium sp. 179-I 3D4 NHS TaxID=3142381 RepID=UPI00399EFD37